eukprot:SAG31_NODE_6212_length_2119_cov_1.734653_3_plen_162_part_00
MLDFVVVFTSLVCDLVLTRYTKGCIAHADLPEQAVYLECNGTIVDIGRRVLAGADEADAADAADAAEHCQSGTIFTLLVVLRMWRVARIVHGLTEVAEKSATLHKLVETLLDDILKVQSAVVKTCLENEVDTRVTQKIITSFLPNGSLLSSHACSSLCCAG